MKRPASPADPHWYKAKLRGVLVGFIITVAAALASEGCEKPLGPTNIPPSAVKFVSLIIDGNTLLVGIGETSQLTAMAAYSDGTTNDVSSAIQWSSQGTGVATVSPSGLVTSTGFGATTVNAEFLSGQPIQRSLRITVMRPGTFTVSGRVREPGVGSLRDVRVVEEASGTSTVSGSSGEYHIAEVSTRRLAFERAGYERATVDATPNGSDDVPLQRVVRIASGGTATTILAPNDSKYLVAPDTLCAPCRLIRVVTSAGLLQLRLTWNTPLAGLSLWIDGRRFDRTGGSHEVVADVPVVAGELLVYVGAGPLPAGAHVTITLTTLAR